jgi:hypothetical protein
MNASDVIRMRLGQATLTGYGNDLRKTFGPVSTTQNGGTTYGLTPCADASGCCSLFDCSGANGQFRYLQTVYPTYQFMDQVYVGLRSEGCIPPSVTLMQKQSTVVCPQFTMTYPLR